jgi:hypothetical protein
MRTHPLLFAAALLALPVAAAAPVAPEKPYELDPVETRAARDREILVRTVLAGLKRNKSDKAEDAELIVCEKGKRTGTNITTIRCGRNRTWLRLGAESMQDGAAIFGMVPAGLPPNIVPANRLLPVLVRASTGTGYNARLESELMEFDIAIMKAGDEFPGSVAEHDARVWELFQAERERQDREQKALVDFVLAFNAVRQVDATMAPGCEADAACAKAHSIRMEKAIIDAGMTVKEYNAAVLKLEIDKQFREQVIAVLNQTAQAAR